MQKTKNGTADSASLIVTGHIPMLRLPLLASQNPPSSASQNSPLSASQSPPSELIKGHILAYYYAGLTNLFCQAHLSPVEDVKDNEILKGIADNSYRDFCMLDSWLEGRDQDEVQASPEWPLYQEARQVWRDLVRNWAMIAKSGQEKQIQHPTDLQPSG